MTRTVFVTGTDTGVGKTTVACALAAALTADGVRVAPFKPAETGCAETPDGLFADDATRLRTASARDDLSLDDICPYRFSPPVAPAVAGDVALDVLLAAHDALCRRADIVLAEGAGGLLVPYRHDLLAADLVTALGAALLVVARASLGTINHTLLTVREAQRRGIPILGIVLNEVAPPGPDAPSNPGQIARHAGVPILGTFPRMAPDTRPTLPSALYAALRHALSV
jgi:dethiobiotin synthetase